MSSRISQMRNGQMLPPSAASQPTQMDDAYINQVKTLMHSKNPTQLLANIIQSNPQMRQVMQMISSGSNPQALAEQIARERGIDLNALINKLMEQ